ncbi:MAG: FHA domain-containing protein [Anaerolineae bacterium]
MSFELVLFILRIVAVVLLYAFLGLAVYLLWQSLTVPAEPASETAGRWRLLGHDPASENGQTVAYPLRPVTTLGRSPENTIVLEDESASPSHAQLRRYNGAWWLEDLGSHSGTLLNGLPVSRPTPLAPGDVIGIGRVRLKLDATHSPPTAEETPSLS